jgi:hypothetical protein
VSVVILEYGLIGESERIAVKTELRRRIIGARERDSGHNTEPASPY